MSMSECHDDYTTMGGEYRDGETPVLTGFTSLCFWEPSPRYDFDIKDTWIMIDYDPRMIYYHDTVRAEWSVSGFVDPTWHEIDAKILQDSGT
jgi:hypothetical protein